MNPNHVRWRSTSHRDTPRVLGEDDWSILIRLQFKAALE